MTLFNVDNYNDKQIEYIEEIVEKCEKIQLHILFEKADNENDIELLKKIHDIDIFRNYCNNHYNLTKAIFDYPNWEKVIKV